MGRRVSNRTWYPIKNITLLFAAFICLNSFVYAMPYNPFSGRRMGEFKSNVHLMQNEMAYKSDGGDCFRLVSSQERVEGRINGTGLMSIYGRDLNETSTLNYDHHSSSYGEICLIQMDRKLKLKYNLVIDDEIDGVYIRFKRDMFLYASISEEEWSAIQSGQNVMIKLDKESANRFAHASIENLHQYMVARMVDEAKKMVSHIAVYIKVTDYLVEFMPEVNLYFRDGELILKLDDYNLRSQFAVSIST